MLCKESKNIGRQRKAFYTTFATMNKNLFYTCRRAIVCLFFIMFLPSLSVYAEGEQDSVNMALSQPDTLLLKNLEAAPFGFWWRPLEDSIAVFQTSWQADSVLYHRFAYVDTLNHNSALYSPFRTLGQPYVHLGVVGSAAKLLLFQSAEGGVFQTGIQAFNPFLWQPENFKVIKTKNPYTRLAYVMGGKKENHLKVQHAQSFLQQRMGLQLDFILHNDLGEYQRQHSDVKNFKIGMQYYTLNKRYRALAYYYHNTLNLQENGGIVQNNDFESNLISNREIISVNMMNAASRVRRGGVAIQQHFFLSPTAKDVSHIPDTNVTDYAAYMVKHFQKPYVAPVSHWGQLSHIFNYQRDIYSYQDRDQNASLYAGLPYYSTADSSVFFDSISWVKIENELRYANGDVSDILLHPKAFNYYVGCRAEQYQYRQSNLQKQASSFALTAAMYLHLSKHLGLGSKGYYYFADVMGGNYLLDSYLNLNWTKLRAHFALILNRYNAPLMMQSFSSSRFTWRQAFKAVDLQKISASLRFFNTVLRLDISNFYNYCYYDEHILPRQYTGALQHVLIRVDNQWRWKYWGADIRAAYQVSSQTSVLRVPKLWAGLKLYYHKPVFKNKLQLEIGIENAYYSRYYADAWMPAIRVFYLQNSQQIGGYLLSDVYMNAKVGKARFFVRYDHFNAHFMSHNYFSAPQYPAEDATFRFGVHWILFD